MGEIAVISDIHGNIEAFKTVLEDIRDNHSNVESIYCLGDVIGYGPDPVECLDHALQLCEFILLGNHEEAVLSGPFGFHQAAKEAIEWTRRQLRPKWYSMSTTRKRWEQLRNFPLSYSEDNVMFVHGSPRDPTMEYILKSDTDDLFGDIPEKIKEIFEQVDIACFVGHTHTPGIITDASKWYSPQDFENVWELKSGERIVCNTGSVGQPRDKDNRASYITVTRENGKYKEITFHRLEYEFRKTQEKIRKIPQIDNRNADRLEFGT